MEHPLEITTLVTDLTEAFVPTPSLSRQDFPQLLQTHSFARELQTLAQGRINCVALERCCHPILDRLSPAPAEGWLRFIYEELSSGLFPNSDRPAPTAPQLAAMGFYLQVLEHLLDGESARLPFDPLWDIHRASPEELNGSAIASEYRAFYRRMRIDHFPALMRIGKDCMPFDPAAHTIGVNNVAVHMARLAREAGLSVDIPLVSAASLSHDIGKFGCRGEDARRIPYLHYYFTWQYLSQQGLSHIAHVAANHSTWDLEFENLPIESLLLIYADFRVRGQRESDGREHTRIYSLEQSYDIILSKLADVTPEKKRRYATVYAKLRDFQQFLISRGVSPDLSIARLMPPESTAPALTTGMCCMDALRHLTFENSLRLMNTLSSDASFEQLLEQAKGEKNLQRIRTYLLLFEEYDSYMPRHSKRMTLSFLYELLMHREGDVRRRAATIMGRILANSGPSYRKELPANAPATAYAPTLMGYFAEAQQLWLEYVQLCLHPDRRISPKHAQRIADSLKVIAESLFSACSQYDAQVMAQPLIPLLSSAEGEDRTILLGVLARVPVYALSDEAVSNLLTTAQRFWQSQDIPLRLTLLRYLKGVTLQRPGLIPQISTFLSQAQEDDSFAVQYARRSLLADCGISAPLPQSRQSELFLSNLKTAVHWTVKLAHIDWLRAQARQHPATAFHTVTHLSNLLCVSEHLPVRQYAGEALLELLELLTVAQQNEIVVDLTRELETGQEQISYYIAPVLGKLLCRMPDKELSEGVDYLDELIHAASGTSLRAAIAALYTLGAMLATPQCHSRPAVRDRALGLLLTGIAHYEPTIHQTALTVLCRGVFGASAICLENRRDCLIFTGKKLLCMLSEPTDQALTFYNHAAMLNHLYRLLVSCEVSGICLNFPPLRPVAFFPGTFDPFSTGHKQIVRAIHAMGYEVYLAIDEFSWSKRTIPKLLRRKLAAISIADQPDAYLYPDDSPVNIASPQDLSELASRFPGRKLALVAGSDVVEGASAYRGHSPGSVRYYDHVIFHRASSQIDESALSQILRGAWQLMRLPQWCEGVSSTRIREDVDKNLDISTLVDPIVQSFIYANSLYVRSPQFKGELRSGDLYFESAAGSDLPMPPALSAQISRYPQTSAVYLRSRTSSEPLGWICGHSISSAELLFSLGTQEAAAYIRSHTSGRLFLVDQLACLTDRLPDIPRLLINELLAGSLQSEHTYALFRGVPTAPVYQILLELGFQSVPGQPELLLTDMRAPLIVVEDVLAGIKEPLRSDPLVINAVSRARQKLRRTLTSLYPGTLLLTFQQEMLSQGLSRRVQAHNLPVTAASGKPLGPYMCVPYGQMLADQVVPNTVTKALRCDKVYNEALSGFTITHAPGYSPLDSQVRTLKSFRRPIILVDDLLHGGHRIAALDPILKEEQVEVRAILVGLLSGQGRDLMLTQGREVDCEYYIPNLNLWLTESHLYPFLGGDSMSPAQESGWTRPAINLVLPYAQPPELRERDARLKLSITALENARDILLALEQRHLAAFSTTMTLERMAQALSHPRLPYRGSHLRYDPTICPSSYVSDDLAQLCRIAKREVPHDLSL